MATQLFLREVSAGGADNAVPGVHRATNATRIQGTAVGWIPKLLSLTRSPLTTPGTVTAPTVAGPTSGIENAVPSEYLTLPLAADVTISGTVTANVWAYETNMSANGAVGVLIEQVDPSLVTVAEIGRAAHTTELAVGPPAAVNNFTLTPTTTTVRKGDRIRVRVYFDDGGGTMASTYTLGYRLGRSTAGLEGDTWVQFTENLTFQTTEPTGTIMYPTTTPVTVAGAAGEREMWTTRGGAATTAVRNTVAGWTAPLQWTNTAGGTALEWYSRPLTAFTLDGLVRLNLRAHASIASSRAGIRAELTVTNGDGSGPIVWATAGLVDAPTPGGVGGPGTLPHGAGELVATETAVRAWLGGAPLAVTNGQRLRLRVSVDDISQIALLTGNTATLTYAGPTGDASGDTWLQLPQTVTEFSSGPTDHPATITTNWGSWTATSTATVFHPPTDHPATITTDWGTVTATATATVVHPATVTTNWGTWTATATGTISRPPIPATITTNWGTWTATATATRATAATIATNWGTVTMTASATRATGASITTNWGTVALTAAATRSTPASITTNWGTWTATATGTISTGVQNVPGAISTNWGTWTATATATVAHGAQVATNWGTWTATAAAGIRHPATVATSWGTVSFTATGTRATGGHVITDWGAWTATAVGVIGHTAVITTDWGGWDATAIGTVSGASVGTVLNDADAVYLGGEAVNRIVLDGVTVWQLT
jgi:hypothetical protein